MRFPIPALLATKTSRRPGPRTQCASGPSVRHGILWIELAKGRRRNPKRTVLLFQRYHRAAVTAECRYALQVAIRTRYSHHGTIAVHGVSAGGKVPAPAFGALSCLRCWLA